MVLERSRSSPLLKYWLKSNHPLILWRRSVSWSLLEIAMVSRSLGLGHGNCEENVANHVDGATVSAASESGRIGLIRFYGSLNQPHSRLLEWVPSRYSPSDTSFSNFVRKGCLPSCGSNMGSNMFWSPLHSTKRSAEQGRSGLRLSQTIRSLRSSLVRLLVPTRRREPPPGT